MNRLPRLAWLVLLAGCAVGPRTPDIAVTGVETAPLDALLQGDCVAAATGYRALADSPGATPRHIAAASVAARQAGNLPEALARREAAARLAPLDGWHRLRAAHLRLESGDP